MPIFSRNSKVKVWHHPWCPYAKRIHWKYRSQSIRDWLVDNGYHECSWCGGIHGAYLEMKKYPKCYPEELQSMKLSYDFTYNAICLRTQQGFWKLRWSERKQGYTLLHLNGDQLDTNATDQELMKRPVHRQVDVKITTNIGSIIKYIDKHDKARVIMEDDWRKLPKKTKVQKKYYKQAKNREIRKSIHRVNEIFKELERSKEVNG